MIQIDFTQPGPFPVGSQIRGLISWTPSQSKQPNAIKSYIAWRTEGRGTDDACRVSEAVLPIQAVSANMPMQIPFEFVLPDDGPVSYNGHLLRIIWELWVEIDVPWATNEKAVQTFVVIPRHLQTS